MKKTYKNGDKVKLRPEYADKNPNEIFTVSAVEEDRNRCRINDKQGRGWGTSFSQLMPATYKGDPDKLDEAYELQEATTFTSWYDWKDQCETSGYKISKQDNKIVALNKKDQVVGHWSDKGKFLSRKAPRPGFKRSDMAALKQQEKVTEAQKQEVYLGKSKSGKCGFFTGNFMAFPITDAQFEEFTKNPDKARAEAQRQGFILTNKEVKESLIQELLQLLEFETPGLKLGALKYDTQENAIYVTIGGQRYKYTPNVAAKGGQIYSSVTGMAKHSTGKALAFLKKNATGEKLND